MIRENQVKYNELIVLNGMDYELHIDPQRGGSISILRWAGRDILRPSRPGTMLDTGCFPLVPFSNRIANGRFNFRGQMVEIEPNMPGRPHPHPLHGFGWQHSWRVVSTRGDFAEIAHEYQPGDWPWPYSCTQTFEISEAGVTLALHLRNLARTTMPAGLGFHPFLPLDGGAVYSGLHRGEWQNSDDCLPMQLDLRERAIDWWKGAPVGSRIVDTVYTDREGDLMVRWPDRRLEVSLRPSDELRDTVVYVPPQGDAFCVEPVSHMTNAVNAVLPNSGVRLLEPGQTMSVHLTISARQY